MKDWVDVKHFPISFKQAAWIDRIIKRIIDRTGDEFDYEEAEVPQYD